MVNRRMNSWRAGVFGALSAFFLSLLLWGCGGAECADGTVEQGGKCVVSGSMCNDGTVLESGRCVPGESSCGDGTQFEPDTGACAPTADTCADGTTFDQATGKCTPNSDVVCGDGTEADANGVCVVADQACSAGTALDDDGVCVPAAEVCSDGTVLDGSGVCVPTEEACGPKTRLDDEGRCVVDTIACAMGTELDPNTGECVVVEEACGAGVALDLDTRECVPTDEVCAPGTQFDPTSRLCLPDACQTGDVLVNGVCMAPAEELAQQADLTETENNDPALGGTAESLDVPAIDDPAFVFTGVIDVPQDLDADGLADQDVDVFTFTSSAGSWINLGVQSLGAPAPGFKVEGPNHFERWSGVGVQANPARQLLLPYDGEYTVTILPQVRLNGSGTGPVGESDWGWVASLEQIAAPAAQPVDLGAGNQQISGRMAQLSNNVFEVSGASVGDLISLDARLAPIDAQVRVQLWQDATTLLAEKSVAAQSPWFVAPATQFRVVLDWKTTNGSRLDFDYEMNPNGEKLNPQLSSDDSLSFTVSADKFDVLELSQENNLHYSLELTVTGPDGDEVYSTRSFTEQKLERVPLFEAGDYTVTVVNDSNSEMEVDLLARRVPPIDLGTPQRNVLTRVGPLMFEDRQRIFVKLDMPAMHALEFAHDNLRDADAGFVLYDSDGQVQSDRAYAAKGTTDFEYAYRYYPSAQSVFIEFRATADLAEGVLELTNIEPHDLGTVSPNQTYTDAASSCAQSREKWYSFSTADAAHLQLSATSVAGGEFEAKLMAADGEVLADVYYPNSTHTLPYQTLVPAMFVARVSCTDALLGLDVELNVSPPHIEDLGSLGAGSSAQSTPASIADEDYRAYEVDLTAGEVLSITHANDDGTLIGVEVRGPNGVLVDETTNLRTISAANPHRYFYVNVATAGTYQIQVSTHNPLTNEVVHLRSITPTDLGMLSESAPVSDTSAEALEEGQSAFYAFTLGTGGDVASSVTTPGGEAVTQRIYSAARPLFDTSDNPAALNVFQQGRIVLEIEADEAIASQSVSLELSNVVPAETEPNDSQASADAPGPLPFTIYGHAEWLGQPGVSDYFAVDLVTDLGASETLEIDCQLINLPSTYWSTSMYMNVRLFDAQGNEIAADLDESDSDTFEISAAGLVAGTYYVGISLMYEFSSDTAYRLDVARQ